MPAVREGDPTEVPVKLELVEVSPGNFIKMNATDKKAHEQRIADEQARQAAYAATLAGETAPAGAAASEGKAGGVPALTVLTKAELVELAEARGLATSGSKAAIAKRFAADDEAETDDETEAEPEAEPTDEQPPA